MRAAVMRGARIEVETLDEPVPEEGQVLLAPLATGICGSDLHMRTRVSEAAARGRLSSVTPGHEFAAELLAAGPDTRPRFALGSLVTAIPFAATPEGSDTVGMSPVRPGGLATRMVVEESSLFLVPDGMPAERAALTEPLAVGVHAVGLANRHTTGPHVVIGCGPIGLAVILSLRAAGRGPIIASDLSPERRAAAAALGADVVLETTGGSPFDRLSDFGFLEAQISPLLPAEAAAPPAGITVFECVGAPGLIEDVLRWAPRHSHAVIVGVCPGEDSITPVLGITKELTLEFSFAYRPDEFRRSLELIASNGPLVETLITSRVGLGETEGAFDRLASHPSEIKILVEPGRESARRA